MYLYLTDSQTGEKFLQPVLPDTQIKPNYAKDQNAKSVLFIKTNNYMIIYEPEGINDRQVKVPPRDIYKYETFMLFVDETVEEIHEMLQKKDLV